MPSVKGGCLVTETASPDTGRVVEVQRCRRDLIVLARFRFGASTSFTASLREVVTGHLHSSPRFP
jgi:hypothetical protein